MDANLAGLVALGALMVGLFAWLRQDIQSLGREVNELRERVARIEGLLEAVFMRRDLTPAPEPPPPAGPSGEPEAA